MATLVGGRRVLVLAAFLALGALGLAPDRALAQFSAGGGFSDAFSNNERSGMAAPRLPMQGGWAEVVTVTPKWLVIQNQLGQQFPVALANAQMFVVRWPTSLDKITPNALVEATGVDVGTNQIRTDHVDVYEGGSAAQLGVFPTVQTIIGMNRVLSAFDQEQHNTYGIDIFRYLTPDELAMPKRLHVVAPAVAVDPLRLAVGGGITVAVLPFTPPGTFYVTTVTPGTSSMVKKGDLVYFVPQEQTVKSLNLAQLVVYKAIPLSQFAP